MKCYPLPSPFKLSACRFINTFWEFTAVSFSSEAYTSDKIYKFRKKRIFPMHIQNYIECLSLYRQWKCGKWSVIDYNCSSDLPRMFPLEECVCLFVPQHFDDGDGAMGPDWTYSVQVTYGMSYVQHCSPTVTTFSQQWTALFLCLFPFSISSSNLVQ